jgi:peptidoglycan/LPS O-acetylase OafA/YrhL
MRTSSTKTSNRSRVARLDGLRGLAVVSVVAFHAETHLGLVARPGGGFVGVAVFFVLSGYLITHLVWRSHDGVSVSGYWAFLRRRLKRLAPALMAFVVIWAVVLVVLGRESIGSVLKSGALAATQTSAFYQAFGGKGNEGWGPTWSLSVEWCFYLLWPLLILHLRRRGIAAATAGRVAIGLGLILYALALPLTDRQFYFLPLANVSILLWGGALALRHIQKSATVHVSSTGRDPVSVLLGLSLIVSMVVAPGNQGGAYRWLFLPAAVVAALMVVDGQPGTRDWGGRLLEMGLFRAVGLRAYSIYLWHVPVMWLVFHVLGGRSHFVVAGVSLLVLIPVVWVSFELLERPWLSGHSRDRSMAAPDPTRLAPEVTLPAPVI